MNINSIRNAISANFKLKNKRNIKKNSKVEKNAGFSTAENSAKTDSTQFALSASRVFEENFDYLPKGSENNNWEENPDLKFYFNASKYPAKKGTFVDLYA